MQESKFQLFYFPKQCNSQSKESEFVQFLGFGDRKSLVKDVKFKLLEIIFKVRGVYNFFRYLIIVLFGIFRTQVFLFLASEILELIFWGFFVMMNPYPKTKYSFVIYVYKDLVVDPVFQSIFKRKDLWIIFRIKKLWRLLVKF